MKKNVLVGVIGLVVAACAGLVGFAAWKILKRPQVGSGVVGRISRDAAVLVVADFRNVRGWQPAQQLRDTLRNPAPDAPRMQRELADRYREAVQNCGFDPWEKSNGITVGVERSVIEGRDQSSIAGFIDGTFTQAEVERCIGYLVGRDQRTNAATEVRHHRVLTPLRQGEQVGPRSAQMTMLPGSVLVTESSYTERALAVIDGDAPALANDSPLAAMFSRLGAGVFLGATADLAELRTRQRATVDGAIDQLVQEHPSAPDLALLRQARTGAVSLALVNNAVTFAARVEVPTAGNAQSLARAVDTMVQQHRGEVLEALRNARQGQQFLRTALSSVQGMTERFRKVDEAAGVLEALAGAVQSRAEGNDAVLSITATQAQVTAVQQGVQAFAEIIQEAQRLNPFGGLLGGGGGLGGGLPGGRGLPELNAGGNGPLLDTAPGQNAPGAH